MHGWVTTPPGPGPHPVLLTIHGGPFAQYGWTLFDETQAYVSAGLRGGAVQSARLVGLRRGARAGDQGRLRRAGRRRRPGVPRRGAGRTRRSTPPGRRHGRLLRGLPDDVADRPHAAVRRRDQRARVHRPGELRRVLRHRVELPRPVPGHRPGAARGAERDGQRLGASPRRRWSSTPRRTGAARWSRAPASTSSSSAAACPSELLLFPGEGHELSRSGRPRHRLARLEHVLRWWARWLPTPQNGGTGTLSAEPVAERRAPVAAAEAALAVRGVPGD